MSKFLDLWKCDLLMTNIRGTNVKKIYGSVLMITIVMTSCTSSKGVS
jgi:hypothetical protein